MRSVRPSRRSSADAAPRMTVAVSVLGDALQPHVELSASPPSRDPRRRGGRAALLVRRRRPGPRARAPPSCWTSTTWTCSACSSTTAPRARPARSSSTRCSTTRRPVRAAVLLVGVGETPAAATCAGPAPRWRAGSAAATRVATSVAALAHDAGLRAFVEGLVLGSFTLRPQDRRAPAARPQEFVLAGLVRPDARADALERGLAAARAGWAPGRWRTSPRT